MNKTELLKALADRGVIVVESGLEDINNDILKSIVNAFEKEGELVIVAQGKCAKAETELADLKKLYDDSLAANIKTQEALRVEMDDHAETKTSADTLEGLNKSLNEQLSSVEEKGVDQRPVFKLAKVSYELVVANSTFNGKPVNKRTLSDNSEVLKTLVKIKSGILRKLKK